MAELRIGSATDKGRVRPENEDNLLITGTAFVVADGMGGHEAGEVASQIAVDGIRERLAAIAASRNADQSPSSIVSILSRAACVPSWSAAAGSKSRRFVSIEMLPSIT